MNDRAQDLFVNAWKQQFDAGMRVVELMTEGATKLRELQLEAAAEAHASAVATQAAMAAARDPAQLSRLQSEWLAANAQKSLAYWRAVGEVAMGAGKEIAQCLCAAPQWTPATMPGADASGRTMLTMIDSAYAQWLDNTRKLYATAPKVSAP
jgi:phasin family protein